MDLDPQPLPLHALDRELWPVRRALDWAVRREGDVPYLADNARKWLSLALAEPIPDAVAECLRAIDRTLSDPTAASSERARTAWQLMSRVDALLGLPLPHLEIQAVPRPVHQPNHADLAESGLAEGPQSDGMHATAVSAPTEPKGPERERRPERDPDAASRLEALGLDADLVGRLAAAGIVTVGDMMDRAPVSQEVLRPVHGAGRDIPGGRVAVGGRVHRRYTVLSPDGTRRSRATLVGAGPLACEWDASVPTEWVDALAPGLRVVLVGDHDPECLVLRNGEPVGEARKAVALGRYGIPRVSDVEVRGLHRALLDRMGEVFDPLPRVLRERHGLLDLKEAWAGVHLQGDAAGAVRLAFDEALALHLGSAAQRFVPGDERGLSHPIVHGHISRVTDTLDVTLTDDQQRALDDIKRDARSKRPMRRVLSGPAGSGRGLVALLAIAMVAEGKSQVLVLSPDAPTAEARFLFAESILRDLGFVVRTVDESPTDATRDALARGEIHVAFAPHGVLGANLQFRRLGLIVYEEDGAALSLSRLDAFTPRPDLLVLPEGELTMAEMLRRHLGADMSVIADVARSRVRVASWTSEQRAGAYARAAEALGRGRQVLVAFPTSRATGGDLLSAADAVRLVSVLQKEAFPGARVALYHGSMSREERQRAYRDFVHARCDVLVATSPAELGPRVPNLGACVVEQAEHISPPRRARLKGQLAASWHGGELILVVGDGSRADEIASSSRGSPTIDSGGPDVPRLQWAKDEHEAVLCAAQCEAMAILRRDPRLAATSRGALGRRVLQQWRSFWPGADRPTALVRTDKPARKRRNRRRKRV